MKTKTQPDAFKILETDYEDEREDVLLERTPDDVLCLLGFDPLDLFDDEELEETPASLKEKR